MIEVKIKDFDEFKSELPEDDIFEHLKYADFLAVYHNGVLIDYWVDQMEKEDAIFCRSLSWIPGIIEKAYDLGRTDQKENDIMDAMEGKFHG